MSANTPVVPGDFGNDVRAGEIENIPKNLQASTSRLQFPPSYVVVGVYRLLSDKSLRIAAWKKCEHGAVRGATVALIWVSAHDTHLSRQPCKQVLSITGCDNFQTATRFRRAVSDQVCCWNLLLL